MRTLERNKIPFWYASYTGKVPILDEDGNETGEYATTHSEPKQSWGNLSPAAGIQFGAPYGTGVSYDHRLTCEDRNIDVTENTYIWIHKDPATEGHDYRVQRVADSLNYLVLVLKKVTTSE